MQNTAEKVTISNNQLEGTRSAISTEHNNNSNSSSSSVPPPTTKVEEKCLIIIRGNKIGSCWLTGMMMLNLQQTPKLIIEDNKIEADNTAIWFILVPHIYIYVHVPLFGTMCNNLITVINQGRPMKGESVLNAYSDMSFHVHNNTIKIKRKNKVSFCHECKNS